MGIGVVAVVVPVADGVSNWLLSAVTAELVETADVDDAPVTASETACAVV